MLKYWNKKKKAAFLEKVAMFDFDKYYTTKVRTACHLAMWLAFTLFTVEYLCIQYEVPLSESYVFSCKNIICDAIIFYLFFYLIVPKTLNQNRIVLFLLSIPLCLILLIIINHYGIILIGHYIKPESLYFKIGIATNLKMTFWEIISLHIIFGEIMGVVAFLSPYFFIKILFDTVRYYSTVFRTEQKANRLEIEKVSLERDFLKAQLNPHFLFNTLNNLYGMVLKKHDYAADVILQLSSIMRYTLYESNMEKVPLSKELAFIKNYVQLETLRYDKGHKITFEINDESNGYQKIAPLLTFVFIENGFKYGLGSIEKGFLEIKICVTGNIFYFAIINDKKTDTLNVNMKNDNAGIGIGNIKKRLELLYPGKYQLTMDDKANSFEVKLEIAM